LVLIPRSGYPAIGAVLEALGRRHLAAGGRVRVALVHPAHDELEGRRLVDALGAADRATAGSVSGLLAALAGAHAVVSGRLHGLVLGAVAGAPVAGLAYDPKVAGFAASIGAPCASAPADPGATGAAVAALARFLDAPTLDREALARATASARDGVRWLLDEALRHGS
jgi:hypothetical protein